MTQEALNEILAKHKLWLEDRDGGELATLGGANLKGTNLQYAILEGADLNGAILEDMNLEGAYLKETDLKGADLGFADLRCANLEGANLQYANFDFSAWPLWCGSLKAHVDDRIAVQLLYHTLSVVQHSPYVSEKIKRTLLTPKVVEVANRFHRVNKCGKLVSFNRRDR